MPKTPPSCCCTLQACLCWNWAEHVGGKWDVSEPGNSALSFPNLPTTTPVAFDPLRGSSAVRNLNLPGLSWVQVKSSTLSLWPSVLFFQTGCFFTRRSMKLLPAEDCQERHSSGELALNLKNLGQIPQDGFRAAFLFWTVDDNYLNIY